MDFTRYIGTIFFQNFLKRKRQGDRKARNRDKHRRRYKGRYTERKRVIKTREKEKYRFKKKRSMIETNYSISKIK